MKPWQIMTLVSLGLAYLTYRIQTLVPEAPFLVTLGAAAIIVFIGMLILRPKENQ